MTDDWKIGLITETVIHMHSFHRGQVSLRVWTNLEHDTYFQVFVKEQMIKGGFERYFKAYQYYMQICRLMETIK